MGVTADEFTVFFRVSNDVVDGYFGCRAAGRRNGNDGQTFVFRRRCPFEAAYVGKFRIGEDDGNGLGCIHGSTAADGYDDISFSLLAEFDAFLYILDGRVRFDMIVNGIGNAGPIEQVCDFRRYFKFHEVLVGDDDDMLAAAVFDFCYDFVNGTFAKIRCFIQCNLICHNKLFLLLT